MLVERNGGHPRTCGTGLVDVPGVIGSISGDMDGKSHEHGHGLDVERREVGHIAFIEGQGEISQHDIAVDGIGGCRHARAVAPDVFLFFFGGAIGLHLVGTRFDAQPAFGVVLGLLVFLEAFGNIGTKVVLFHVGVDVLDIVGDDFARARNFPLQGLHALCKQVRQQALIQGFEHGVQMTHAGDGVCHVEAVGLRQVDVGAKAQFKHQERMIEQVGTPARSREVVLADPDQRRFEIGARWMGRPTWPTPGRWIDGAPVKEGEAGTVALHDGIGVAHLLYGGLVKWSRDWYDRDHEGCSCQSRVAYYTSTLSGSWPLCQGPILETSFACF